MSALSRRYQVLQVAVRPVLDQLLHYLQVALLGGDHQRGLAALGTERTRSDHGGGAALDRDAVSSAFSFSQ